MYISKYGFNVSKHFRNVIRVRENVLRMFVLLILELLETAEQQNQALISKRLHPAM